MYPSMHWADTPKADTPSWADTPREDTSWADTPSAQCMLWFTPPSSQCSGWDASYWNGFLLAMMDHSVVEPSIQTLFTMLFYSQLPQQSWYNKTQYLIGRPYLVIISSNEYCTVHISKTVVVSKFKCNKKFSQLFLSRKTKKKWKTIPREPLVFLSVH